MHFLIQQFLDKGCRYYGGRLDKTAAVTKKGSLAVFFLVLKLGGGQLKKQPVCLIHFSRTLCWTETLFPYNFHICSFSFAASKVFKTLPHLLMYEVDRAGVVH